MREHDPRLPWMSLSRAARKLGVKKRQIRRSVRQGALPAVRIDGRWRVLLPSTPEGERRSRSTAIDGVRPPEASRSQAGEPIAALIELLRETQRQNLELAGQLGYLQRDLEDARDRIKLLEAPPASPVASHVDTSKAPVGDASEVARLTAELQRLAAHVETLERERTEAVDRSALLGPIQSAGPNAPRSRWRFRLRR